MKKRGLAAALAMLTMATTGTAFAATNFWQPVYYQYSGNCVLRINAAQSEANYTVWGKWNPNG